MRLVEHRIGDRRVLRLIRNWLKAGVVEDGVRQPATKGTPQGAVISPLLANIYLHYVHDLWAEQWRRHLVWLFQRLRRRNLGQPRHAQGAMIVVRYADDTVVGFQHRADAEAFLADLRNRMADFDLELQRADRLLQHRSASRLDPANAGEGIDGIMCRPPRP